MKMVNVGMYADQTGLYSESELSFDNFNLYIFKRKFLN